MSGTKLKTYFGFGKGEGKNLLTDDTIYTSRSDSTINSSTTSNLSAEKTIEQAVDRLCYDLRRNIFKETKRYSRAFPEELELLLKSLSPTDPLFFETTFYGGEKHNDNDLPNKPGSILPSTRWASLPSYVVVSLAASIGPGSFAFFPWEAIQTGVGLLFLIPVILSWVMICAPIIDMETSLGQLMRSGPLKVFAILHKRAIGVGVASFALLVFVAPSELFFSAQALYFVLGSMHTSLPWAITPLIVKECQEILSNAACVASAQCLPDQNIGTCQPSTIKIIIRYLTLVVTGGESIFSAPPFHTKLFGLMVVTLLFVAVMTYNGPPLLGRLASFITVATCMIFGLLLISARNNFLYVEEGVTISDFINSDKWYRLFTSPSLWIRGFIVALASSYAIKGNHYILASYTTFGTNTIHCSWFNLLLQVYVCIISAVILSANIYANPSQLVLIDNYKKSCNSTALELGFVLFPISILQFPGAPLLSMLLFLVLWLQSLVRLTLMALIIVTVLTESRVLSQLHVSWCCVWAIMVFLWASLPYVLNFGPTSLGVIRINTVDGALLYLLIPMLGVIQVGTCDLVHGRQQRKKFLGKAGGIWRLSVTTLYLVILGIWLIANSPTTYAKLLYFLMTLVLYAGVLFLLPLKPPKQYLHVPYKTLLYWWTIGGLDSLRKVINDVIPGISPYPLRLCILWPILLIFYYPFVALCGIIHGFYSATPITEKQFLTITYAIVGIGLAIIWLPIIISILFPRAFALFYPEKRRRWSTIDVPKKYKGPKYAVRRLPLRPWEEFFSSLSLCKSASALRFTKVY